jgi:hypothetical protein
VSAAQSILGLQDPTRTRFSTSTGSTFSTRKGHDQTTLQSAAHHRRPRTLWAWAWSSVPASVLPSCNVRLVV